MNGLEWRRMDSGLFKHAPGTASERRRGHIPRRYNLVMPFAISPPTSPSGGIAVDTIIRIAIGVAGPIVVTAHIPH